jgi:hypothetical protein
MAPGRKNSADQMHEATRWKLAADSLGVRDPSGASCAFIESAA